MVALPSCSITLKGSKPHKQNYPANPVIIGEHIRKVRMDRGLPQKDVASIIGVTEDCITNSNWENNRPKPISSLHEKIVSFLGYIPPILLEIKILREKLKVCRKEQNLTQKELAAKIGISLNTLRNIENNGKKILHNTKIKLDSFFSKTDLIRS